jgi:hypothetical protein
MEHRRGQYLAAQLLNYFGEGDDAFDFVKKFVMDELVDFVLLREAPIDTV